MNLNNVCDYFPETLKHCVSEIRITNIKILQNQLPVIYDILTIKLHYIYFKIGYLIILLYFVIVHTLLNTQQ